jgi:DNA-binding beta-propeller fold protein YncE
MKTLTKVLAVNALLTGVLAGVTTAGAGAHPGQASPEKGILWVEPYDGPASLWDYAHSVALSPDGSKVFVTGGSTGSGTALDYTTIAHSTA